MKKIGLIDVKQALKDPRFRDNLPQELKEGVIKYLENPSCACNISFYRKIINEYPQYLLKYFPGAEVVNEQEEIQKLSKNNWTVINCHISELEKKLQEAAASGRKQIAVSRYQDQATIIINHLDLLF